jgi:hypothetical protein
MVILILTHTDATTEKLVFSDYEHVDRRSLLLTKGQAWHMSCCYFFGGWKRQGCTGKRYG